MTKKSCDNNVKPEFDGRKTREPQVGAAAVAAAGVMSVPLEKEEKKKNQQKNQEKLAFRDLPAEVISTYWPPAAASCEWRGKRPAAKSTGRLQELFKNI